jgi:hypothetical protein
MSSQFPISSPCPFERNKGVGCNSLYCGLANLSKTFFDLKWGKRLSMKHLFEIKFKTYTLLIGLLQKVFLIKVNMGSENNLQHVKININIKPIINVQLDLELLKEFKDTFTWIYNYLKGIPLKIVQH